MARNKYPEITEERILQAAERLFLEKGYDNTTIQDIVDALGDLTKGAVYHHFKSKEDIMEAVGDRMFVRNNPFAEAAARKDLNGLEKLRASILMNQSDDARMEMTVQSMPILENPRFLASMIRDNQQEIAPYLRRFLEEGIRDGSIHTEYPKELSEVILLLTGLWMVPQSVSGYRRRDDAKIPVYRVAAGTDGGAAGGRGTSGKNWRPILPE